MPHFECLVCHSQDTYYENDGVTFCGVCNTESQDHGQQLVVDDETIGAFDRATAGALKTKRIKDGKTRRRSVSKARKRYLEAFKVSFYSSSHAICRKACSDQGQG